MVVASGPLGNPFLSGTNATPQFFDGRGAYSAFGYHNQSPPLGGDPFAGMGFVVAPRRKAAKSEDESEDNDDANNADDEGILEKKSIQINAGGGFSSALVDQGGGPASSPGVEDQSSSSSVNAGPISGRASAPPALGTASTSARGPFIRSATMPAPGPDVEDSRDEQRRRRGPAMVRIQFKASDIMLRSPARQDPPRKRGARYRIQNTLRSARWIDVKLLEKAVLKGLDEKFLAMSSCEQQGSGHEKTEKRGLEQQGSGHQEASRQQRSSSSSSRSNSVESPQHTSEVITVRADHSYVWVCKRERGKKCRFVASRRPSRGVSW